MWSTSLARLPIALLALAGTLAAAAPAAPPRESAELRLEADARGRVDLRLIVFTLPPDVDTLSRLLGGILGSDLGDVSWDVDTHKRVATLTARVPALRPREWLSVRGEVRLGPLADALSAMGVPTLTVVLHHPRCGDTQCSLGRPVSPNASPIVEYAGTFPTSMRGPTVWYRFGYLPAQAGKCLLFLSGGFLFLAGLRGLTIWKGLLNVGQGIIATFAAWTVTWVLATGDLLVAFLFSAERPFHLWIIQFFGTVVPILTMEVALQRRISRRSPTASARELVLIQESVLRIWPPAALAASGIVLLRERASFSWVGWIALAGMAAAWTAWPCRWRKSPGGQSEVAFGRSIPSTWAISLLLPAVAVSCSRWLRLGDIGCLGVYSAALGAVGLFAALASGPDLRTSGPNRPELPSRDVRSTLLDGLWFLTTLILLARVADFPFNLIEGDEGWRLLLLGMLARGVSRLVPRLPGMRSR